MTVKGCLIGFLIVAGTLIWSVPATTAAEKAKVVYADGGRILSVKADGSGRQVIASRFKDARNTDLGFVDPAVSPDGQRLAYANRVSGEYPVYRADIFVSGVDGSGRVKVLSGNRNRYYSSPGWTPDGQRLLVAYYSIDGWKKTGGILSLRPDGSDRRVIFKLKSKISRKDWVSAPAVGDPVMSPDGTRILFVRLADWQFDQDGRLEVLDLGTGRTKTIAKYSHGGAWSPDGDRIVHSERATGDDEVCGIDGCVTAGRLMILNADGTGSRRLVKGDGYEMEPDWSSDGSRIVFQSNRNMNESVDAYEIYSVEPDGGCLTWLTNGTPASTAPAWSNDSSGDTSPDGCGSKGRKPLLEVPNPVADLGRFAPSLWLGQDFRGSLISGAEGQPTTPGLSLRSTTISYNDCSRFEPSRCGAAVYTVEYAVCALRGGIAAGFLGDPGLSVRRGVPFGTSEGDGSRSTWIYSGGSIHVSFREASDEPPSGRQILAGYELPGAKHPSGKLPAPRLPRLDLRRMKRVLSSLGRTGSVRLTARRLSMKPRTVRANRTMDRLLDRLGPVRTVDCPRGKTSTARSLLPAVD